MLKARKMSSVRSTIVCGMCESRGMHPKRVSVGLILFPTARTINFSCLDQDGCLWCLPIFSPCFYSCDFVGFEFRSLSTSKNIFEPIRDTPFSILNHTSDVFGLCTRTIFFCFFTSIRTSFFCPSFQLQSTRGHFHSTVWTGRVCWLLLPLERLVLYLSSWMVPVRMHCLFHSSISRWFRQTIIQAHDLEDHVPSFPIKAHFTRSVSFSLAIWH